MSVVNFVWWLVLLELAGGPARPATIVADIDRDAVLLAVAVRPGDAARLAFWCRDAHGPVFRCFARMSDGERLVGEHPVFDDPLVPGRVARLLSLESDAAWLADGRAIVASARSITEPRTRDIVVQFIDGRGSPVSPPIVVAADVVDVLGAQVRVAPDDRGGAWVYWAAGGVLSRRYVDGHARLPADAETVGSASAVRIAGDTVVALGNGGIVMRDGAAREVLGVPQVIRPASPVRRFEAATLTGGGTAILWATTERNCTIEGVAVRGAQRKALHLDQCPARWALGGGDQPVLAWVTSERHVVIQELRDDALPRIVGDGYDTGFDLPALFVVPVSGRRYEVVWRQPARFVGRIIEELVRC